MLTIMINGWNRRIVLRDELKKWKGVKEELSDIAILPMI